MSNILGKTLESIIISNTFNNVKPKIQSCSKLSTVREHNTFEKCRNLSPDSKLVLLIMERKKMHIPDSHAIKAFEKHL